MRFSIYLNAQSPDDDHDRDVIEQVTYQAKLADRSGFEGVCLTEHHFTGYNTYGNPFTFGAYLAPQLSNSHIILSVAVPALWNPLNFAEACNTLDMLTRGRCVIGVGTGGSPQEYRGLGRDTQDRAQLMEEVLEVATRAMLKAEDDEDLVFKTSHDAGTLARRIMPSSYERTVPHFARAVLSDEGAVATAERGWSLMTARDTAEGIGRKLSLYREALAAAGHDAATLDKANRWTLVQKMVYIGETDESALADVTGPLDYLDYQTTKSFSGSPAGAGFKNSVVGVSASDRDEFLRKAMIVGSVETVVSEIEKYEAEGVNHLAIVFAFGQMDPELSNRSMQRFIDEVMPRFRTSDESVTSA